MFSRVALLGLLIVACSQSEPSKVPTPLENSTPPDPTLAPNAPTDMPVHATTVKARAEQARAIAPYIEQGRKTYPDAKRRYLAGLPRGHNFFVTTTLQSSGAEESVFIAVTSIKGDKIAGTIANDILTVTGYKIGDVYTFAEADLIDWLIAKPDGSEEGNVVGKYLDEWGAKQR